MLTRELTTSAIAYLAAGLSVIPTIRNGDAKRVALPSWKRYQAELATPDDVYGWNANSIGVVCGAVSGNVEMIDFDDCGSAFDAWAERVRAAAPGLLERLLVESTPSGGRHVVFRCEVPVDGNAKLAMRREWVDGPEEIERNGKRFKPRQTGGRWHVDLVLIETRGEGGMFLCAPSPGYELHAGSFTALPVVTARERQAMHQAALELSQAGDAVVDGPRFAQAAETRPGDEFNARGDVREVLRAHGWVQERDGENEHWRRPGKADGTSATLKGGVFYVFSSNAPPFEPSRGYSPFAVFALLEHGGNYALAAADLRSRGFGAERDDVDLSALLARPRAPAPAPADDDDGDPGPLPERLLSVPGFIDDVMRYDLSIAFRPQPVLALAGAIALQAVLAGRKVRDTRGGRTAVQLVGVAPSGAGKDNSRSVCKRVLHLAGLSELVGPEDLASDAGMYAVMVKAPASLFLVDEFGRFLRTAADPKRAPHLYAVTTLMMRLYTSAGQVYLGKAYADGDRNREVNQPCAVVYGSTVPEHFYQSLTIDALGDGFLSRLLVLEAQGRGQRNDEAVDAEPPQHVVERARAWGRWNPGYGDLTMQNPEPFVAQSTPEAEARFRALADQADSKPQSAEYSLWTRAVQKARQMALVYACSAAPELEDGSFVPTVDGAAAEWGCDLVTYVTRRMLFLARAWVADGEFDRKQLKVLRIIRDAGGSVTHWGLTRKLQRWSARERTEVLANLVETGQVEVVQDQAHGGGPGRRTYVTR